MLTAYFVSKKDLKKNKKISNLTVAIHNNNRRKCTFMYENRKSLKLFPIKEQ